MRLLVLLQNAWSAKYAGRRWPRKGWLKALDASRSGQRLASLRHGYPYRAEWVFDNVTPICGATPDSVVPADLKHVNHVITLNRPDVIIACGRLVEKAMDQLTGLPLWLAVPHPAHRVLTNCLYFKIGQDLGCLATGLFQAAATKVTFRQRRGSVEITPHPWLIPAR